MPYKDPEAARESKRRSNMRPDVARRRREYGREYYSRPEVKERYQEWYRNYKQVHRNEERLRALKARRALKLEMVLYKGGRCSDCEMDLTEFPECADFDHVRGTKTFALSKVTTNYSRKYPPEDVLAEIDKCDLVCANCHRKRTVQRWRKDYPEDATDLVA